MTPITTKPAGRIIGGHKDDSSNPELIGVAALVGTPVINGIGESLGEIRDVLMDAVAGQIAYAVLELCGCAGMEDKLFAVPWIALTLDADNRCFILNVDKRRLKEAPCFAKEEWLAGAHSGWSDEVLRFFSAEPFWRYHA